MNLAYKFVSFSEISHLTPEKRINKLLDFVKKDKIVLLQGRLKPSEEAWLIQKTMELQAINKAFKGIELFTMPAVKSDKAFSQIRGLLAKVLIGSSEGLTLIGPGTIIKEIRSNPDRSELLTTVRG